MKLDFSTDWNRDTLFFDYPHARLQAIAKLLANQPNRRLLDVGCSTAVLHSLLPEDFTYHGCDLAEHALAKLPADRFCQVDLNCGGLQVTSEWAIDVISMSGVIEYMQHPDQILTQARQLVPADGRLIVSLINFRSRRWMRPGTCHPTIVYRPTLAQLSDTLQSSGWKVDRQIAFFPPTNHRRRLYARAARWLGPHHWWTRRKAHQFLITATAA